MIKSNIILDGSYLLYKNVFILKKLKALPDLLDLLERDFNTLSKAFTFDNVYFASDSRESNWRKLVYKEYKGKRKKVDIDWEFVFKTYDEFKERLALRNNVKLLEYSGLEGDDFIAYIVKKSNKEGFSNIIIASDGDLQQLLTFDLNKNYINIQWNYRFSDQRLYLPKNYQLFLDKLNNSENNDIFSLDNDTEFYQFIVSLIQKTKIADVIQEQIIFEKIVQGDTSDNIISIIKIKNGVYDEKGRGIGKEGAKSVYKLYKEIHPEPIVIESDDFIKKLVDVVIYYKKIKNPPLELKEKVKENIIFNRMLITLDTQYMPEQIFESLETHFNLIDNQVKNNKIPEKEDIIIDDIDENFRIDETEDFDPDSYWEI
jgi:hypothetical protein